MSDKTHADIIAEMREFAQTGDDTICVFADRLEAAHEREIYDLWNRIGNKTKLREAVERCLAVLKRIDWLGDGVFPNGKFVSPELLTRAIQEAEAALAAPPRNCDRFSSGKASREAQKAWLVEDAGKTAYHEWLFATAKGGMGKDSENEAKREIEEIPRLLPCSKCGKDTAQIIHPAFDGGAKVACQECHYDPQEETWDS